MDTEPAALRRAQLWWHTVKHLRPSQVVGRARLQAQAAYRRHNPDRARRRYDRAAARLDRIPSTRRWTKTAGALLCRATSSDLTAAMERAANAKQGRFQFLNDEQSLGRPIAWHAPGPSQLWRYQLQYGGYLMDLAATHADAWPAVSSIMREWIAGNRLGETRDAWHPFVASERLVNWIFAIHLSAPVDGIGADILRALAVQTVFVDGNLETDVGGNHLLKNLKAMVVAACFWNGREADRWYEKYADRFTRELQAQLLSDGAHYERSPMYHALVLADALELTAMIRASGRSIPDALAGVIRAMVAYLPQMTHPDGEIALFNDSVLGEAPSPASLRAFAACVLDDDVQPHSLTVRQSAISAHLEGPVANPGGGWSPETQEDGGLVTIPALDLRGIALIDVGPACPDDLPAHAHGDIFSFELSLDGQRMIVDSGVGEYQAGPWRDYYRSTRAHNTVAVDGEDQIECWGSFRVARRARILDRQAIAEPFLHGITARHDGYARLAKPVYVRRVFVALADSAWLVIDSLEGTGAHTWESFIHAAPDVSVDHDGERRAQLSRPDQRLAIACFGFAAASVVRGAEAPHQGWYAPEFGRRLPASVLVLSNRGPLPAHCGYLIVPDRPASDVDIVSEPGGLRIRMGSSRFLAEHSASDIRVRPVS
ncbi:MAG TPA: alginate lyase family protein [Vicinamibacterales bacterium]|nr:alginate lyase family protein [Vicinamibacterales bacterium]